MGHSILSEQEILAPFLEGLATGRLLYQKCGHCGTSFPGGRFCCESCWSDNLVWKEASGLGTLYSFVVYHRQFHQNYEVPYNFAIVELNEGPRIPTNVRFKLDELYVGMELRAHIEDGVLRFDAEPKTTKKKTKKI